MSEHQCPFGISQYTTTPWPFEKDIEVYEEVGGGFIEICEVKLDPVRLGEQLENCLEHGLTITSVQPSVHTVYPNGLDPQPADPEQRLDLFRRSIDRIAPYTPGVPFVANTGAAPDGGIDQALHRCAAEFRKLADYAADAGVKIAIEPLSPALMNMDTCIWTLSQARELIEAVDRPNFGACLDSWNNWQDQNLFAEIAQLRGRIHVVQVSDWRTPRSFYDRAEIGRGKIPLAPYLHAVRGAGYTGAYVLEIFSKGVPGSLWEGDIRSVITRSRTALDHAWERSFEF